MMSMPRILYIAAFILIFSITNGQNKFYPIGMNAEHYTCYRTVIEMSIDGIADEESWNQAQWTADFVDIEGHLKSNPPLQTRVKMLWDDNYFYVFAEMEEPHVWGTLTERDAVIFLDDDFEIFIDPDKDGINYYELEINAIETLWELILLRAYRADSRPKVLDNWNLLDIHTAVHVNGTVNDPSDIDEGWSVEWAIPFSALEELADFEKHPNDGDLWKVDFSRVDWEMEVKDGKYIKRKDADSNKILPESNWVWSPTGKINMHMPEMWGTVQFTNELAGSERKVLIKEDHDEVLKSALWYLYQAQLERKRNGLNHTINIDDLIGSDLVIPEEVELNISTTPDYFDIRGSNHERTGDWVINSDGRIYFSKY